MKRRSLVRVTRHGRKRMDSRRIPEAGVEAALEWGRRWHGRGVTYHRLDRRSVMRARRRGVDLGDYEGITVVAGLDGAVVTVYRNRQGNRVMRWTAGFSSSCRQPWATWRVHCSGQRTFGRLLERWASRWKCSISTPAG